MIPRRVMLLSMLLLVLVVSASSAWAQFTSGIEGTVTDPTGAVVSGATVTIKNEETGASQTFQTGDSGSFRFTTLASSAFTVSASAQGFKTTVQEHVRLAVAETKTLNIRMVVGGTESTVTVTDEAPAVETAQARVSGQVSEKEVHDLPLSGRNFYTLVVLTPGVSGLPSGGGQAYAQASGDIFNPEYGVNLNANGSRAESNSFLIDSASIDSSQRNGVTNINPNAEDVQEVMVLREGVPAAAAELRLAVAQRPEDAEGHDILGTVLLKSGDVSGAIEEFRRAITLNPELAQAHASLAQALQRAGQKEEAQKQLADLEHINQGNANVGRAMILVETAENHMKKGEQSTAVGELQEAVTLSPDFTEAHYQLGLALRQSSDGSTKAEAAFRQVLQLDPNHALAHLQLGLLLAARGDKTRASSDFEKAAKLAPGLTEAHRSLGRLAADSRDWATAIREFQAVIAWTPEDPSAHYDLAAALKARGQLDEAAHKLQIAQKLDPKRSAPH